MNTTGYCTTNRLPRRERYQFEKIGTLVHSMDSELANFFPENANATFVLAIHTCRLAVKALKKFF